VNELYTSQEDNIEKYMNSIQFEQLDEFDEYFRALTTNINVKSKKMNAALNLKSSEKASVLPDFKT
jgi:hypothetical protein